MSALTIIVAYLVVGVVFIAVEQRFSNGGDSPPVLGIVVLLWPLAAFAFAAAGVVWGLGWCVKRLGGNRG